MRILNILFPFLLLWSSCSQNKLPEGVMNEQKMVKVLADLHIVDGYMSSLMYTDSTRLAAKNFYDVVYETHDISKSAFEKSLKYYSQTPVLLDSLYSKADDLVKIKEDRLNKIEEEKQRKQMQSK